MGVNSSNFLLLTLDVVVSLTYLVALFMALRRQKGWTSPAFWLAGYALLSLALHTLFWAGTLNWLPVIGIPSKNFNPKTGPLDLNPFPEFRTHNGNMSIRLKNPFFPNR